MTVPAQPGTSGPLAGDGQTDQWSADFSAASASEVVVYRTPAGGSASLVSPSEYTVALQTGVGVTVTYPLTSARVPEGDTIEVRLSPTFDQPTRLTDQGSYDPAEVMAAMDHIVRQTIALQAAQGRNIPAPAGINVQVAQPVNNAPLYWRLLESGAWLIDNGAPSSGTPATLRVLYADDLGLAGDGTDETDALNARILEYSATGPAIFFLRAPIGYWRFDGQVKNRSGIALSFNSPIKVGATGCLAFVGGYAREAVGATVSVATSAGASVIPVTPVGGSISGEFAADDQIELGSQRVRVTAVDDGAGTVTVTPVTTAALAAGATLRKLVHSYISSSWTRYVTPSELVVADPTKFPLGCMVWVTDDETVTHTDGVQTSLVNSEMAKVIGYGVGSIKLDRSIRHWMTTGNRARVVKIDPCAYATIQGASIEFTEAPTGTRVDTFECSLGYKCEFLGCSIPNEDNYGSRGQGFRFYRSYTCTATQCSMGPPKYTGDGEGYGVSIRESTGIKVNDFEGTGNRHVLSFSSSTDSEARAVKGRAWRNNLVEWHGLKEIGCWFYDIQGEGTDVSDATARQGIGIGNGSWLAGCFECGGRGGEITGLDDAAGMCIRIQVPSDDIDISGVVFRQGNVAIYAENVDNFESTEAGRIRIACDFHRIAKCGTVDMDRWGGTGKPFNKLDLSGSRFFDWVDGIAIDNCDDVVTGTADSALHMETTRAAVGSYAIDVQKCTAALIKATLDGCQKHIKLVDTPARVEDCEVRNPQTTTWIDELSASPISGGVRDLALRHPASWTPARVSAQSTLTVYSLPGML